MEEQYHGTEGQCVKVEGNDRRQLRWRIPLASWIVIGSCGWVFPGPGRSADLAADGLHRLSGRYVTLITDLPLTPAVTELPEVFDQAVPQWAKYFGVRVPAEGTWHVRGCLIRDRARFRQAGLLPEDLPPFPHGYQRGDDFWVLEQPSEYFLRHLVLHEGTHAFMRSVLGGAGPAWYMEGIAELFGTHRWQEGRLTLRHFPERREAVPYWGRIKLIQGAVAGGQTLSLGDVLQLETARFRQVEPYAWAWAAAVFLDGHPRWRPLFRRLPRQVRRSATDFTQRFWRWLQDSPQELQEAWQLFLHHLDYGYAPAEDQITYAATRPASPSEGIRVLAQRGWQSTGLILRGGQAYRIRATGRYQMAKEPQIWWCEPNGVTLEYYEGSPLGMLLAAVRHPAGSGRALRVLAAARDRRRSPVRSRAHRSAVFSDQ